LEIVSFIKIDGLNKDKLHNEYSDIKFTYEAMKSKNVNIRI